MHPFKTLHKASTALILILILASCLEANRYHFPASTLKHQVGEAKPNSSSWIVKPSHGAGMMSFGPYATYLPEGRMQALFGFRTDSMENPESQVLTIDVFDNTTKQVLAQKDIYKKDFNSKDLTGIFTLNFLNNLKSNIEFRVYYKGVGNFEHVQTSAIGLSDSFKFEAAPAYGFNLTIWLYESGRFGATPMSSEERVLRRNFSTMASLGAKYIRVMFNNNGGGFTPKREKCATPDVGCDGAYLSTSVMDKIVSNMTQQGGILDIAEEYGLKIIPMFSGNAYYWNAWPWSYMWYDSYGASKVGFEKWVRDATFWVNRIVSGIEASPKAARTIVYYDLWNEFDHFADKPGLPEKTGLIESLLKNVKVAPERLGLSLILSCDVPQTVKTVSERLGKPFKYIEIHSYPEKASKVNGCGVTDLKVGDKIEQMKRNYPGATYLLAEYSASGYADENEHADIDLITY